jgi:hypothetical protein
MSAAKSTEGNGGFRPLDEQKNPFAATVVASFVVVIVVVIGESMQFRRWRSSESEVKRCQRILGATEGLDSDSDKDKADASAKFPLPQAFQALGAFPLAGIRRCSRNAPFTSWV